ncbi:hypothetical protein OEIGOIKO_04163 [Streptomyces chrestomyceticus JCM 4735]|uniref:Uncharacterized protein n=1 Tax=Streptomyces chrestomyceticus JCM 4735 TaxID=1306181 RepID=A0A7U9PZJ6_9ACTN|nr:hypothetical protein OEIGOIKO_04163 [Streptomyces chrestomyceticus JCM 4735]
MAHEGSVSDGATLLHWSLVPHAAPLAALHRISALARLNCVPDALVPGFGISALDGVEALVPVVAVGGIGALRPVVTLGGVGALVPVVALDVVEALSGVGALPLSASRSPTRGAGVGVTALCRIGRQARQTRMAPRTGLVPHTRMALLTRLGLLARLDLLTHLGLMSPLRRVGRMPRDPVVSVCVLAVLRVLRLRVRHPATLRPAPAPLRLPSPRLSAPS